VQVFARLQGAQVSPEAAATPLGRHGGGREVQISDAGVPRCAATQYLSISASLTPLAQPLWEVAV
jgi:hypothetical protein